jgi:hypothetical protein
MCTCIYVVMSILYICVYSFVVLSCLFFYTTLLKTTVVFCPDTPLANESLFQSANERSELEFLKNLWGLGTE